MNLRKMLVYFPSKFGFQKLEAIVQVKAIMQYTILQRQCVFFYTNVNNCKYCYVQKNTKHDF